MRTVFLAALMIVAPHALAQPPRVHLAMSANLREALERSGFEEGIRMHDAPDLDRKLTSSAFGTSPDTFVAGYYFEDELKGDELGPLHVSLFDRSRGTWLHKQDVYAEVEKLGMTLGGSLLGVGVTPKVILLDTHVSPSAGFTVVLDRSLDVVTSFLGYGAEVMNDGSIWYFGGMVHFADTHQETLHLFDLSRREELEIFPGPKLSPVAEDYRRQIQKVYAGLPANRHATDFDRSIQAVVARNSTTFAFVVGYGSDYLDGSEVAHPTLTTVARCDRRSTGTWSCSESEIALFARGAQVPVSKDSDGRYDQRALDTLIQAALARKP